MSTKEKDLEKQTQNSTCCSSQSKSPEEVEKAEEAKMVAAQLEQQPKEKRGGCCG